MKIFLFFIFAFMAHSQEIVQESLIISGATTIQPIIEDVALEYRKTVGVELFVEGGGTEGGLKKLRERKADIAMVARELSHEEKLEFAHVAVAVDAVAVVFNKNNFTENLTKEQLTDIYSGKTKGFRVISRATDRATLDVFETYSGIVSPKRKDISLKAKCITGEAWEAESNINTLLWVAGLKNSIAIVSHAEALRYIEMGYPIVIASVEGVAPTNESIKAHKYPITRTLSLVWNKENQRASAFLEWSKQKPFIDAIEKLGFVAVER